MSPKERLAAVLRGRNVDRPPVICPGGMMNAAVVETMGQVYRLPEAHDSGELMAGLAAEVCKRTGFENIGLPFCMTVEAEMMGSRIDRGSLSCEPKIEKEAYASLDDVPSFDMRRLLGTGRAWHVLEAVGRVSKSNPSLPVTGVVTGPVSAAASIVDPTTFFKELRKNRNRAHQIVDRMADLIVAFARMMLEAGASAITVADPSVSGEILGPTLFEEYAIPYLNKVADGVKAAGGPVIVHICGDMRSVKSSLGTLRADGLSLDSVMNLPAIKRQFPSITTVGNVSTQLLSGGSTEKIRRTAARLVREGVDVIAPACGLDARTSLESIRALTDGVRERAP